MCEPELIVWEKEKLKIEKVYGAIKEFGEASQMLPSPVKCLKLEQRIKDGQAQQWTHESLSIIERKKSSLKNAI